MGPSSGPIFTFSRNVPSDGPGCKSQSSILPLSPTLKATFPSFPGTSSSPDPKKEKKGSPLSFKIQSSLQRKHHLSFVALSVGFLLIWTCVISALLLSDSVSDATAAQEALTLFQGHQDVGRVLFALGHEMVSTVDLLLSAREAELTGPQDMDVDAIPIDSSAPGLVSSSSSSRSHDVMSYSKEALQITWQMTDLILNQVIQANHLKLATLLQLPYERWMEFRARSISLKTDPRDAVSLYLLLSKDLERHYQRFPTWTSYGTTSHTTSSSSHVHSQPFKSPFVNTGISYALFNSGMFQRFAEIALGTCYFKSNLLINHTEYLDLQFTSRALIEAAFQFHPKAQHRLYELRANDVDQIQEALSTVRQDMLAGGKNRNNSQYTSTYLEGVKDEISHLLLTKDYLNTTICHQMQGVMQLNRSTLLFHVSVTAIALVAVLSCMILLCCQLRSLSSSFRKPGRERIIYKANTFHNQHHHHHHHGNHMDARTRSQTLPIETVYNPFNLGVSVDRTPNALTSSALNVSSPSSSSSSSTTSSNSSSSSNSNNNNNNNDHDNVSNTFMSTGTQGTKRKESLDLPTSSSASPSHTNRTRKGPTSYPENYPRCFL